MKLIFPLFIEIPRKKSPNKRFYLGLNPYRNTNFHTLNQAKVLWKEVVRESLEKRSGERSAPPYRFVYTIYPSSGRKFDLGNVLSIVQKFTDDALSESGIIPDDNYKIIPAIDYRFGAVDKENPRVELEILQW